jgi:hypothetical protein
MKQIDFFPHLMVFPIVVAFLIALAVFFYWLAVHTGDEWDIGGMVATVLAVIVGVATVLLYMPYDSKYYHFYTLKGEITSISNSINTADGDFAVEPIIEVEGYEDPIVVDSRRILTYNVGDEVSLVCTISWEPYGLDQTNCGLR